MIQIHAINYFGKLDNFGMFRGQGIGVRRRPIPWHTLALPVDTLKRGRCLELLIRGWNVDFISQIEGHMAFCQNID